MITDVFLFNGEFDMLRCRMYELRDVVDRFIAIEGDRTFTGLPREPMLTPEMALTFGPKLTVVRAVLDAAEPDQSLNQYGWINDSTAMHWTREQQQRDAAEHLLSPDDIVLYGDVDEIPRDWVVSTFQGPPASVWMRMLRYSVYYGLPDPWAGTVIGHRRDLGRFSAARLKRGAYRPIHDGGWHLSWFGTPEDREAKLAAFSHQELRASLEGHVGTDLPASMRDINGGPVLGYTGDAPAWVAIGNAPDHWYKQWHDWAASE